VSGQARVLAILAVLTAILMFRGTPGETVVFWLVLGCIPIGLGTIAQTWKGRGAAWWLVSLIVMLLFYFVTAASYTGPDARITIYLAGALRLLRAGRCRPPRRRAA
jgi:hypothetical protein